MDNVTPPPFPTTCVIKLDQIQYAFYKKNRLEIHSPNGKALTVLSKQLPVVTDEDAVCQLYCEMLLLEALFYEIGERVKLPLWTINSVARVIGRIDRHIKEKLSV